MRTIVVVVASALLVAILGCSQSPTCECEGQSCTCIIGGGSTALMCGATCGNAVDSTVCECGPVRVREV